MMQRNEGVIPRCLNSFNKFNPRNIAILALICAAAATLVVLGCALHFGGKSSPIALICLFLYLFTGFPLLAFSKGGADVFSPGRVSLVTHLAYFLTGAFAVSGPWLAFVLYHTGRITIDSMILVLSGGAVMVLAFMLFHHIQKKEAQDRDFGMV
eukprot:TRINITY_DN4341_c0_g2_i1.p1 TRINITY_DN4341_c0_g2~~TRINITY_DN4341_c0_g2_i1.p1  ORF type:complete len:154 (+),score=17.05 TRINITY_DN4341_c0_g2_i1:181-642(+)